MTLWNKLLSIQRSASSVKSTCLHTVHVGTTLGYNDTFIWYIHNKVKTNFICLRSKYLFWTLTRERFTEGRLSSYTYITHNSHFPPLWLSSHTYMGNDQITPLFIVKVPVYMRRSKLWLLFITTVWVRLLLLQTGESGRRQWLKPT